MKVTIMIEPEEVNEGVFGNTTVVTKDNVVLLDQLVSLYTSATRGAGWEVDRITAITDSGKEFWGEY